MKKDFNVSYDSKNDILYIAKKGEEEEFVEVAPGVNVELDKNGEVMGFEIFKASRVLKKVLSPLSEKLAKAS